MIPDAIVTGVVGLLTALVNLLPDVSLPDSFHVDGPLRATWQGLIDHFGMFTYFIPFDVVGTLAPIVLGVFVASQGIRLTFWVIDLVKGWL